MITPTSPSQAPAASPAGNGKTRAPLVPFVRASTWARYTGTPQVVVLGAAPQTMNFVIPATNGWARRIGLLVQQVDAANVAAVTYAANAPWNVFTNVLFTDAGQQQLINLRGYDLYLVNLYGGYLPFAPDTVSAGFYLSTAVGPGDGGSFTFELILPIELGRDGIGSLPNMDANQRYNLTLSINTQALIYGVLPTNAGTLTVTPIVYYYTKPDAVNARGRPAETTPQGAGTIQFWRSQVIPVPLGQNQFPVPQSGRYVRNMFGVFETAAGVRSDVVKPTTGTIQLMRDNNFIYDVPFLDLQSDLARHFGIAQAAAPPVGFVPFHIGTYDPDGTPGGEWGDSFVETSTASQFQFRFVTGAAGNLFLLSNEVQAPDDTIFRYG